MSEQLTRALHSVLDRVLVLAADDAELRSEIRALAEAAVAWTEMGLGSLSGRFYPQCLPVSFCLRGSDDAVLLVLLLQEDSEPRWWLWQQKDPLTMASIVSFRHVCKN